MIGHKQVQTDGKYTINMTYEYYMSVTGELHALNDRIGRLMKDHASSRASKVSFLRNILKKHVPDNLQVGRGFVVTPDKCSYQIDVLIYDKSCPLLYKDGDLVFITPDAAAAILEVLPDIPNESRLHQIMGKLSHNSEIVNTKPGYTPDSFRGNGLIDGKRTKKCFTGLFSFESKIENTLQVLAYLKRAAMENPARVITHTALGRSYFYKFWEYSLRDQSEINCWEGYNLDHINHLSGIQKDYARSHTYFINSLISHLSPENAFSLYQSWFPMEDERLYKIGRSYLGDAPSKKKRQHSPSSPANFNQIGNGHTHSIGSEQNHSSLGGVLDLEEMEARRKQREEEERKIAEARRLREEEERKTEEAKRRREEELSRMREEEERRLKEEIQRMREEEERKIIAARRLREEEERKAEQQRKAGKEAEYLRKLEEARKEAEVLKKRREEEERKIEEARKKRKEEERKAEEARKRLEAERKAEALKKIRLEQQKKTEETKKQVRKKAQELRKQKGKNNKPVREPEKVIVPGIIKKEPPVPDNLPAKVVANITEINKQDLDGNTALHRAASSGNADQIVALVDSGADVNIKNRLGNTPLHMAAATNNTDISELLLISNADVKAENYEKNSPLHLAAINNNAEMVDILMDNGADINVKNKHEFTPLHQATIEGSVDAAEALIKRRAEIHARAQLGLTPLHLAALQGDVDAALLLINWGADVNVQAVDGNTPLHCAAARGHVKVIKLLIRSRADMGLTNAHGKTYLDNVEVSYKAEDVSIREQKLLS